MQPSSIRTVCAHWGQILDCDPERVLSSGVSVVPGDRESVELLLWEGGAAVGVPEGLGSALHDRRQQIHSELSCEAARTLVEPHAAIDDVLGPQFVGYCDRTTFESVETDGRPVDPDELRPLRAACPAEEWDRAVDLDEADRPTFAVFDEGEPVAASQLIPAHGVAGIAVITHPEFRNRGRGKSVVSRATTAAFERDLLPEYRTIEHWESSVALATDLGFEKVARSILVQLSGDDH